MVRINFLQNETSISLQSNLCKCLMLIANELNPQIKQTRSIDPDLDLFFQIIENYT